jgi:intein/homing endonuclease
MLEKAYIAGLFDGEGSIGIYKVVRKNAELVNWSVKLAIYGTYRPTLQELYDQLGYGSLTTQKRQALNRTPSRDYDPQLCKQGWKFIISNKKEIRQFLLMIHPYLREKVEQADIMLKYIDGKLDGVMASVACKKAKRFEFKEKDYVEINSTHNFKGSNNPWCKLNESDVIRIKRRLTRGEKQVKIAKEYNVNKATICSIAHGRSWSHVIVDD